MNPEYQVVLPMGSYHDQPDLQQNYTNFYPPNYSMGYVEHQPVMYQPPANFQVYHQSYHYNGGYYPVQSFNQNFDQISQHNDQSAPIRSSHKPGRGRSVGQGRRRKDYTPPYDAQNYHVSSSGSQQNLQEDTADNGRLHRQGPTDQNNKKFYARGRGSRHEVHHENAKVKYTHGADGKYVNKRNTPQVKQTTVQQSEKMHANFSGSATSQHRFSDTPTSNRKSNYNRNQSNRGRGYLRSTVNFKHASQQDIETQRGLLIEQLTSNTYECMICCEAVRREVPVWSCNNCYHVFHLHCIQKWAVSSTAAEDSSSDWRCPACQNISLNAPSQYLCFCDKTKNPAYNRHDTPHSCGEVCGKIRSDACVHPCNILCHPGPCPPCLASITKHCHCTKTKQVVKCAEASTLKCTEICMKTQNCGRHECQQVCHAESCDPCQVEITQVCYCTKETRTVLCGSSDSFTSTFSCKQTCSRRLSCGNHDCDRICHPGECSDCLLLPSVVTFCPCGKTRLEDISPAVPARTTCTDPIPTCFNICGKPLPCGNKDSERHLCQQKCHVGLCGPCQGESIITCRCGIYTKEMPCAKTARFSDDKPFLCDKRCNKKRSCGKHKCSQCCCVDEEHKCEQKCRSRLSCGLHRCEETCHRNNCPTCWHVSFDELKCHCGAAVLYPPIPCGVKPPVCQRTCSREHPCGHPVSHSCHSDEKCPPCTHLTEKPCYGRHEVRRNIPCFQKELSCGLPCNKDLPCGIHKCQMICHKGSCMTNKQTCTQPCPRPRSECSHPCGAPCHGADPCPQTACRAEVAVKCECGHRTERIICMIGGDNKEFIRMEMSMMAMSMSNTQDGQTVDISAIMKESNKKKQRRLECNAECSQRERNKRLALALEIKNPDISGKLGSPKFTTFLKDYAKQNTTFVASIEQEFCKLVQSAQKSKQTKRSHAFKPMNSNQRRLVHELAEFYGCQTMSYDEEPNKNVVATAHRGKCWLPNVTLTQLTQRENHPKPPVPIPHVSNEADIRNSVADANRSTSVIGAWGKLAPAANPSTTKSPPWMPAVPKHKLSQKKKELKSLCVLRKDSEQASGAPSSPAFDYFDMS